LVSSSGNIHPHSFLQERKFLQNKKNDPMEKINLGLDKLFSDWRFQGLQVSRLSENLCILISASFIQSAEIILSYIRKIWPYEYFLKLP